jgi:hypothetical protein
MNRSEHINELATALSKAQGEMESAKEDSLNPHFKSKYADLHSIWSACRGPLSRHGLAIIQTMDVNDKGQLMLVTLLTHTSGQWVSSNCPVITQRQDPQGYGAALTYFKRYSLSAMVGVSSDEDDDAERAMDRVSKTGQHVSITIPSKDKSFPAASTITELEWKSLNDLLSKCTEDHQNKVWLYLDSQKISCEKDIDKPLLQKLTAGALKNIEKQKEGNDGSV